MEKRHREHRRYSESSEDGRRYSESSDDEIPLKLIKFSRSSSSSTMMAVDTDDVPLIILKNSVLNQYSMESCGHCSEIFHTKYDELIHTAKHLKVPLTRLPVYECNKCNYYCTSQQRLHTHTNTKHTQKAKKSITTVPNIFNMIVNCKPIVRCDDSLTKLIKATITNVTVNDKGSDLNSHVGSETKAKPKNIGKLSAKSQAYTNKVNKDLETDNIARKKPIVDILDNIVNNKLFVKCDNSVNAFIKANTKTNVRKSNNANNLASSPILSLKPKESKGISSEKTKTSDNRVNEYIQANAKTNDRESNGMNNIISSPILSFKPNESEKISPKNTTTTILTKLLVSKPVLNYDDRVTALIDRNNSKNNFQSTNNTQSNTLESIIIKKEPVINYDSGVTDLMNMSTARNGVLESMLNRTAVVECDNTLKKLLSHKVHIADRNARHTTVVKENGVRSPEDIQIKTEPVDNLPEIFKSSASNLKSRIIFEDDDDDFEDDLIQFSIPNVKKCEHQKGEVPVSGKFTLGTRAANSKESVHYDDLMRPGLYFCKHCKKSFPNRFTSISHEMIHMQARPYRTQLCHVCDRYIAGGYRALHRHYTNKHPESNRTPNTAPNRCGKCSLKYYDRSRHFDNYHHVHTAVYGERFVEPSKRDDHDETHAVGSDCDLVPKHLEPSKEEGPAAPKVAAPVKASDGEIPKFKVGYYERPVVRQFCEICALFLKDRNNIKYVCVGELSELGKKQTCSKCGKNFFAVKLVKTLSRKVDTMRKYDNRWDPSASNENRLKHIQQRLKFYNTLTRF